MRILTYVRKKLVAVGLHSRARLQGMTDPLCRAWAWAILDKKRRVVVRFHHPGMGLFAHLNWLIWTVAWGERTGRRLKMECTSPNYAPEAGGDWFPVLFQAQEPWMPGRARGLRVHRWEHLPVGRELGGLSIEECREILRRHFAVSEEMAGARDAFVAAHYRGAFVVGLHYRGTDKRVEAPRVAYEAVLDTVRRVLECAAARSGKKVVLFVASDEAAFLERVKTELPEFRVCLQEGALRSAGEQPVHLLRGEGLRKAREAFMDCLLLGETNLLIKTASMLSGWAPIIGHSMPVLSLSDPFERCFWFPDCAIAQTAFRRGQEAEVVEAALALEG